MTDRNIPKHDIIVVGAGFAGIYTSMKARDLGYRVLGIEAGSDVGGTWYWNRYPGARCDVESIDYSYSFDPELEREWRWSERYATQPEILRYLTFVANRYDVYPLYRFEERVVQACWDEAEHLWRVTTDAGASETCRWLIMATGSLSAPILPNIPGLTSFEGDILQTAAWPHNHPSFEGKRVGVIGTGSSGIQVIPEIAREAASVHVFQRTPNYSVPAFNYHLDDAEWEKQQQGLPERRRKSWEGPAGSPWTAHPEPFESLTPQEREEVFEEFWHRGGVLFSKAFEGQLTDEKINTAAKKFFEKKLAEKVADPELLRDLTPTGYAFGAKRICTDSGYYETFSEPHVELVNLHREPIERVSPQGIHTSERDIALDLLVFATGFDAMTGALTSIDIYGRTETTVREAWHSGYRTLLGVGIPGFPNLLALNGPGSPSVFANMALCSEQQGNFALELIGHCTRHGITSCEAREDAAEDWAQHTQEVANNTLFAGAPSWYTGSNIEGKPGTFLAYPGGFNVYQGHAKRVAEEGYAGFVLSARE